MSSVQPGAGARDSSAEFIVGEDAESEDETLAALLAAQRASTMAAMMHDRSERLRLRRTLRWLTFTVIEISFGVVAVIAALYFDLIGTPGGRVASVVVAASAATGALSVALSTVYLIRQRRRERLEMYRQLQSYIAHREGRPLSPEVLRVKKAPENSFTRPQG